MKKGEMIKIHIYDAVKDGGTIGHMMEGISSLINAALEVETEVVEVNVNGKTHVAIIGLPTIDGDLNLSYALVNDYGEGASFEPSASSGMGLALGIYNKSTSSLLIDSDYSGSVYGMGYSYSPKTGGSDSDANYSWYFSKNSPDKQICFDTRYVDSHGFYAIGAGNVNHAQNLNDWVFPAVAFFAKGKNVLTGESLDCIYAPTMSSASVYVGYTRFYWCNPITQESGQYVNTSFFILAQLNDESVITMIPVKYGKCLIDTIYEANPFSNRTLAQYAQTYNVGPIEDEWKYGIFCEGKGYLISRREDQAGGSYPCAVVIIEKKS